MSIVSGFCRVSFSRSLLIFAKRERDREARRARGLAGGGGVVVAFDEVVQIHERVTGLLAAGGLPRSRGVDHDVYGFAAYGLAVLLLLGRRRPRRSLRAELSAPARVLAAPVGPPASPPPHGGG
jgi:hypothetical protein